MCVLNNISNSRIVAVEPQPGIVDLLYSNLEQFGSDRYQIAPVALSDHDGEEWFEICLDNSGLSRLVSEEKNERAKKIDKCRVKMWSGDRLFADLDINKLDLVKIDVEGYEETVIGACLQNFSKLQPRAIVFESWGNKCAPGGSIGAEFKNIGYNIFGIDKYLMSFKLVPILSKADCRFNDYVAVSGKRFLPKTALLKL